MAAELASAGARHVVLSTRRRLAARADRLPPPRRGAVSFASPLALLALLLVPAAAVGYVWFQRRRVRESAQFVEPALLPERRRSGAAAGAGTSRVRCSCWPSRCSWSASRGRTPPSRCAPRRRRRSSRSTPRDRWARPTSPPTRLAAAQASARRFLAEPAGQVPRRGRRLQLARAGRVAADDRPRVRGLGARRAPRRRGDRARRGARDRGRGRDRGRRRARSCPPAQKPPPAVDPRPLRRRASTAGASRWPRRSAGRATAKVPVFTALLGTEAGVVQVPHVGGYIERIQVPPDPDALRARGGADGRQLLRRHRPRPTSAPSTRI